jgi:hypothetical protein
MDARPRSLPRERFAARFRIVLTMGRSVSIAFHPGGFP